MKKQLLKQGILTMTLLACIAIGYAQEKTVLKNSATSAREGIVSLNIESDDATQTGEQRINFKKDNKNYFVKMIGYKVTALYVDGQQVAEDRIHQYYELLNSFKEQIKKDRAHAGEDRKLANIDREQAIKARAQAEKDRQQAEQDRSNAAEERARFRQDRQQAEKDREQAMQDSRQVEQDRRQVEKDKSQAAKHRKQAELDRTHAEENSALVKDILEAIIKDKLVINKDGLTRLELSSAGFWINGKKQTDQVHHKYKSAFLKTSGAKISFSNSHSGYNIQ